MHEGTARVSDLRTHFGLRTRVNVSAAGGGGGVSSGGVGSGGGGGSGCAGGDSSTEALLASQLRPAPKLRYCCATCRSEHAQAAELICVALSLM